MKWLIAPLLAATILGVSGFLDALERTTVASTALARTSEAAPEDTREAAVAVEQIPAIAELTTQQASAFKGLADALDISAERVFSLNDALERQLDGINELEGKVSAVGDVLGCVQGRLEELRAAARLVPDRLGGIRSTMGTITASQNKAIRHLRSINRKMAALGVVAEASDVQVPPPPDAQVDLPQGEGSTRPC